MAQARLSLKACLEDKEDNDDDDDEDNDNDDMPPDLVQLVEGGKKTKKRTAEPQLEEGKAKKAKQLEEFAQKMDAMSVNATTKAKAKAAQLHSILTKQTQSLKQLQRAT